VIRAVHCSHCHCQRADDRAACHACEIAVAAGKSSRCHSRFGAAVNARTGISDPAPHINTLRHKSRADYVQTTCHADHMSDHISDHILATAGRKSMTTAVETTSIAIPLFDRIFFPFPSA